MMRKMGGTKRQEGRANTGSALEVFTFLTDYLLNFLLIPARPKRPEPKRSNVAGTGVAEGGELLSSLTLSKLA